MMKKDEESDKDNDEHKGEDKIGDNEKELFKRKMLEWNTEFDIDWVADSDLDTE